MTLTYLDGLSFWNFSEDPIQTAVIADRKIAEIMVGVADDGHGSIWKARCSTAGQSEQDKNRSLWRRSLSTLLTRRFISAFSDLN